MAHNSPGSGAASQTSLACLQRLSSPTLILVSCCLPRLTGCFTGQTYPRSSAHPRFWGERLEELHEVAVLGKTLIMSCLIRLELRGWGDQGSHFQNSPGQKGPLERPAGSQWNWNSNQGEARGQAPKSLRDPSLFSSSMLQPPTRQGPDITSPHPFSPHPPPISGLWLCLWVQFPPARPWSLCFVSRLSCLQAVFSPPSPTGPGPLCQDTPPWGALNYTTMWLGYSLWLVDQKCCLPFQ